MTKRYAFTLSKIKATRSNWSECNVIWLHRKRIIMHCSVMSGDGNNKLVILHEQRHDVPHLSRIDKNLVILNAFSLKRYGWHVV